MLNKRNLPFPDINLAVMALSSTIPPPQLYFSPLLLPLNSSLEENNNGHWWSPSNFNNLLARVIFHIIYQNPCQHVFTSSLWVLFLFDKDYYLFFNNTLYSIMVRKYKLFFLSFCTYNKKPFDFLPIHLRENKIISAALNLSV